MLDSCKKRLIPWSDIIRSRFYLHFYKGPIRPTYNGINTIVIHKRNIDIHTFFKHFSNDYILHPLSKSSSMSKRCITHH